MKVGIISADPRKVCWKTYFYHGIWRRCRVSCEPEPWWDIPTPPVPPPLFYYDANVLPEDFVPPYVIEFSGHVTPTVSGSILYLNPVPGDLVGPGYEAVEKSVGYFVNHMRYELGGCVFDPPVLPKANDDYAAQEVYFYSRTYDDNFIHFIQEFWWSDGHWEKIDEYYEIYTFVHHNLLDFRVPFQGFYIDLNYNPAINKTTIDYNGLVTEEVIGKITIYPAFYTGSSSRFAAQQIDFERIIEE